MTPAMSTCCLVRPRVKLPLPCRAFSLIEVMVAVTLMSVIVLGLLAMFSQTQRAFRTGITQVDVMEGGRAACELMAREMEQITATGLSVWSSSKNSGSSGRWNQERRSWWSSPGMRRAGSIHRPITSRSSSGGRSNAPKPRAGCPRTKKPRPNQGPGLVLPKGQRLRRR